MDRIILKKYKNKLLSWDNLSIFDKLAIFQKWYLVTFLGDLCIVFGTMFFYASNIFDLGVSELIIGVGTFLIWLSVVKYFENTQHHYTILRTMARASP